MREKSIKHSSPSLLKHFAYLVLEELGTGEDGVGVGVQILGQFDEDERLTSLGRWLAEDHFYS